MDQQLKNYVMETMMNILRVELPGCGSGMYSANGKNFAFNHMQNTSGEHPPYRQDVKFVTNYKMNFDCDFNPMFGFIKNDDFYFGFVDFDQFKKWVSKDGWIEGLKNEGFVLSTYEVDSKFVCVGDTQLIFKKSKSKRLSYQELSYNEI